LCSENTNDKHQLSKAVETKDVTKKYSREKVRQYVFSRFFNYISNYDKVLEQKFPSAMHVYRVFMLGVKDFYVDMKKYFKINGIVNSSGKGIRALTRKEMELFQQMPRDLMKVGPVLLISALPFANYVVFPLAYVNFLLHQLCEISHHHHLSLFF
jgi:LETM1-like protein